MEFTAKDVVDLREKTGAGMLDCKKALAECNGNVEKAMDMLREKGKAAAAKKVIVNAKVNEAITSETAQITGSFSAKEASQIGKLLSAGNMNFELKRTDIMKVDGAYGTEAFNKSLIAGIVGLLAVIVMMILIYKIPGAVASLTLLFYTAAILVVFNLIGGE